MNHKISKIMVRGYYFYGSQTPNLWFLCYKSEMHNFNFLRMGNPNTFDYSKRKVIRNTKILALPTHGKPNHMMDELRVRNFVTNAPRPRQIPTVDTVEQERLRKYGARVDIDPQAFAERLMKMTLKLPQLDANGAPVKDQTGRMVYRYYTYKDVLASPLLRQFRAAQLRAGRGDSVLDEVYGEEEEYSGDVATELDLLKDETVSTASTDESKEEQKRDTLEPIDIETPTANPEQDELAHVTALNLSNLAVPEVLAEIVTEGERGDAAERRAALRIFNATDRDGATAFRYVLDRTHDSGLTPQQVLTAWIALVSTRYGTRTFNLYAAVRMFKSDTVRSWLARRNRVIEGIMLNYTDRAASAFADRVDANNAPTLRLSDLIPPRTAEAAVFLMRLCSGGGNAEAPMKTVIRSFLYYVQKTIGDGVFNSVDALRGFMDTGGVAEWDQLLTRARQEREPPAGIEAME